MRVCFIDTPGHSAFVNVRSRGVQATDIVALIVAADSGVQRQTIECVKLIKAAAVPFVVCITKIDKKNIDLDNVKEQLFNLNVDLEKFGGTIPCFEISSITGDGIDRFLKYISQKSSEPWLRCDLSAKPRGTIIDCRKTNTLGLCVTAILRDGHLCRGDRVVCSSGYGKVFLVSYNRGAPTYS